MAGPLEHASRRIDKVTHVALPPIHHSGSGGAIAKMNYVRKLVLQRGDVERILKWAPRSRADLTTEHKADHTKSLVEILRQHEGNLLPGAEPEPSEFAHISVTDLLSFGKALEERRKEELVALTQHSENHSAVASLTGLLHSAMVANKSFAASGAVSPVGMLSLERLEMTPAGITRGDLISTIPLAPGETTTVYQKEWSVTSSEFTSIVTDSLDNYSETGVTQDTELAQATTAQNSHNNQYNITATASGGCGFVSGSVTASTGAANAASASETQSRKDAVATTRKASSRVKQSHKVSISTSTTAGNESSSTRTLSNPSPNAIRIDYFSLMEEWRVRLYRYGARLTYDLTIPEPGATLRRVHAQLEKLQKQASETFTSPFHYDQIEVGNYKKLQEMAEKWGAQIPAPPIPSVQFVPSQTAQTPSDPGNNYYIVPLSVTFSIADGQEVDRIEINYNIGENHGKWTFGILGYGRQFNDPGATYSYEEWNVSNVRLDGFMVGATGSITITCIFQYANPAIVSFNVHSVPTAASIQTWQAAVYSALYNAAQTQYYSTQQSINAQIKMLQDQIDSVDSLTLRREENDEIMKGILRFLLGIQFDFMPAGVIKELAKGVSRQKKTEVRRKEEHSRDKEHQAHVERPGGDEEEAGFQIEKDAIEHGEAFADAMLRLPANALTMLAKWGEKILFINEAIEWENLTFFLDSYFWDIPASWEFVRQIQHPDSTRQTFLRAGSARVVVTVRKGYEVAWTQFLETGSLSDTLSPTNPYMTIAQEIQNYDDTNYPGIPPANPAGNGSSVIAATNSSERLSPSIKPVKITVESSVGFIVGYVAQVDCGQNAEKQLIVEVGRSSITVQRLVSAHDGSTTPLLIAMDSEAGTLIAEWNEYTPTSGTDIAVTSNLTTIA
jgi:hypothetical protein